MGNTELVLAMPPIEQINFKTKMIQILTCSAESPMFLKDLTDIETSKMEASVKNDLELITNFMLENLGGFETVNQSVSSGLRRCIGKTAFDLGKSFKLYR